MLNERDYELLSSYLDGELSASERMALESRLDAEDDLRRELASLRQTVALVNQLPKLKAPRNFTMEKPAAQARPIPFPMTATFSALSAAAAVLLLVFGGFLLTTSTNGNTSASPPILAYGAEFQVAQAPTGMVQNSVNQAPMPQAEREITQGTEASLADSVPSVIAPSTMTQNAQASLNDGQGGAAADQAADFFAATAPPSPGEDMAASSAMMLESSANAERDDETATSASGLTQAVPPQLAIITTPVPTMVAQGETEESTVQRAAAPTASPAPTTQPTPVPQQKVTVEIDSGLVGLLSIIVGTVLLIAALVTTLARRRKIT